MIFSQTMTDRVHVLPLTSKWKLYASFRMEYLHPAFEHFIAKILEIVKDWETLNITITYEVMYDLSISIRQKLILPSNRKTHEFSIDIFTIDIDLIRRSMSRSYTF